MSKTFGPTGRYPRGTLGPHDEGELQFGVAHDHQGNVHGKPVSWFALPQAQAINLARLLLRHAGVKKVEIEL
jgi:hypothetical protein